METNFYTATEELIDQLLFNAFGHAFFGAFMGLAIGIYLIRRWNRNGSLDRPLAVWSWVVKLYKIYIPFVLVMAFSGLGFVYGINSTVSEFVEAGITGVLSYLQGSDYELDFLSSFMISSIIDEPFDKAYWFVITGIYFSFLKLPTIELTLFFIHKSIFGKTTKAAPRTTTRPKALVTQDNFELV